MQIKLQPQLKPRQLQCARRVHTNAWDQMHERHMERSRALEAALSSKPLLERKKWLYAQDHQMYDTSYIVFETNAPLTASQMSLLTWQLPWSGRMSVSFSEFSEQLQKRGFSAEYVRTCAKTEPLPTDLETVIGATGNY